MRRCPCSSQWRVNFLLQMGHARGAELPGGEAASGADRRRRASRPRGQTGGNNEAAVIGAEAGAWRFSRSPNGARTISDSTRRKSAAAEKAEAFEPPMFRAGGGMLGTWGMAVGRRLAISSESSLKKKADGFTIPSADNGAVNSKLFSVGDPATNECSPFSFLSPLTSSSRRRGGGQRRGRERGNERRGGRRADEPEPVAFHLGSRGTKSGRLLQPESLQLEQLELERDWQLGRSGRLAEGRRLGGGDPEERRQEGGDGGRQRERPKVTRLRHLGVEF